MDTAEDKKLSKKQKIIIGGCIGLLLIVLVLIAGYFIGEGYYGKHFLKGTVLNDMDVSGLRIEEVNQKVADYTLQIEIRAKDGSLEQISITGDDIGLCLAENAELKDILESQQAGRWLLGKAERYELEELTQFDQQKWEACLDELMCFEASYVEEPKDAYVETDTEKKTFTLVEEIKGNEADRDKVTEVLEKAVKKLQPEVSLETEACYLEPEITAENKELKEFYETLEQYLGVTVTYHFGEEDEELTGEDIYNWLLIDYENQTVTLNPENVTEYVSYLKWKHDSIFSTRRFMTSYGREVTVEGGDYGWWMDKESEITQLTEMIQSGESGERTPVYFQEAAAYGDCDYGNTYIEINLTSQHLFLYVDGEKILESDLVSGKPNGHATPAGTYAMTYTESFATLNGDNYSTPVSFWMPFNEDIGLHDATWQTQFGANIYQKLGSHGCINLPYYVAKQIFQYAYKNMPVICYHLPGTESTSVTVQTDEEKAQGAITAINDIASATNKGKQTKLARKVYNDLRTDGARAQVTNYGDLLYYESIY